MKGIINRVPAVLYVFCFSMFLSSGLLNPVKGQTAAWEWASSEISNGPQETRGMVVDSLNRAIYITGEMSGIIPASLGGVAYGLSDGFLARYDFSGNQVWGFGFGGIGDDAGNSVAVDQAGNVYVSGFCSQIARFPGTVPGPGDSLTVSGGIDAFVAKFSPSGQFLWVQQFGTNGNSRGLSLSVDPASGLYVTGYFDDVSTFGNGGPSRTPINNFDVFVVRMNPANGAILWANEIGGAGELAGEGLGISARDSAVYVTGKMDGNNARIYRNDNTTAGPVLTNTNPGRDEGFLVSFAANGTVRWGHTFGSNTDDEGLGVSVSGNAVYVTGFTGPNPSFPGGITGTGVVSEDIFVSSHSTATGTCNWARIYPTTTSRRNHARGIFADGRGNLIVTGEYEDGINFGGTIVNSRGQNDFFLLNLSTAGAVNWVLSAGGNREDRSYGVAGMPGQAFLTCGSVRDGAIFGTADTLGAVSGNDDFFLACVGCGSVGANVPPVANRDEYGILRGQARLLDVLDNDTDPDGDPIATTAIVTGALSGAAVIVNGDSIRYTPNLLFTGVDSFAYSVCDTAGNCDSAWVVLNVHDDAVNLLPIPGPLLVRSGALIIGMDNTTQDSNGVFNLAAYGLVNALLQAEIPVRWAINHQKGKDSVDFSAVVAREFPSALPAAMLDFKAGPFVVDSFYADTARTVIAAFGRDVQVYRLLQNRQLNIRYSLSHKPRVLVMQTGGNTLSQTRILDHAGFGSADYTVANSLGNLDSNACFTFASDPSWVSIGLGDSAHVDRVERFILSGGNVLAQGAAVVYYELVKGFATGNGVLGFPSVFPVAGSALTGLFENPISMFGQFEGPLADALGFGGFELGPGSAFQGNTIDIHRAVYGPRYKALLRHLLPGLPGGFLFYLGGTEYRALSLAERNGMRLYLNGIMVPATRPAACNLDFAADLGVVSAVFDEPRYCQGDTACLTVVIENQGPGTSRDISVLVTRPGVLTPLSGNPSRGVFNTLLGLWTLDSLALGSRDSVKLLYSVDSVVVSNLAVGASAFSFDRNGLNNLLAVPLPVSVGADTANAGPDQDLCNVFSASLTANAANFGNGRWEVISGTGTFTDSSKAVTTVSGLGPGVNALRWVISDTCSSVADTVEIRAWPLPTVANAGVDSAVCDTAYLLSGNAPAVGTGIWSLVSGGGRFAQAGSGASLVDSLALGLNVYAWTISSGTCPVSSDSVTIERFPEAGPVFAGADTVLCDSAFVMLADSVLNGKGSWSVVSGSGVFSAASDENTLVSGIGVGQNVYAWTVTSGPCPALVDSVVIGRDLPPSVAFAGADSALCDSVFTLGARVPGVGTGLWSVASGSGVFAVDTLAVTSVSGLVAGANVFVWRVSNGLCPASVDSVVVRRDLLPSAADAGVDFEICTTDSFVLDAVSPVVGTGLWGLLSGSGAVVVPGDPASAVLVSDTGLFVLEWVVTNGLCPASRDSVSVFVLSDPGQADAGLDVEGCFGDALVLNALPAVGGGWSVVNGSGLSFGDVASASSSVTVGGAGVFDLLWSVGDSFCRSLDTMRLEVFAVPAVPEAGEDEVLYLGRSTSLLSSGAGGFSGGWSVVAGGGVLENAGAAGTGVSFLRKGENVFRWTVSNGPCAVFDEVRVSLVPFPEVRGFSPNGDGMNDSLVFRGLGAYPGSKLTVLDRWGNVVFESVDYQNDWTGIGKSGEELADDTYMYVLEVAVVPRERYRGTVVLKR